MDGNASYRNNYFVSVCLSRVSRFAADNLLPSHSSNGAVGLFSHQKFLMSARAVDKTTSKA